VTWMNQLRFSPAPENGQFPPFGTPIGCVFDGLLLAGLAVFLYQVGTPDVPRNDIVQISDAKVERAYKRCNSRGLRTCWMRLALESWRPPMATSSHSLAGSRATTNGAGTH
jgi:hypothetical protein